MSLQQLYSRVDGLLARQYAAMQAGNENEVRILRAEIAKLNKEIDRLV